MARNDDVPQTVGDAKAGGWAWLTVKCLACKHRGDIRFDDYVKRNPAIRLSAIAGKVYCSKCRGRRLGFALGLYVLTGSQPIAQWRDIEFAGDRAVRPSRD